MARDRAVGGDDAGALDHPRRLMYHLAGGKGRLHKKYGVVAGLFQPLGGFLHQAKIHVLLQIDTGFDEAEIRRHVEVLL